MADIQASSITPAAAARFGGANITATITVTGILGAGKVTFAVGNGAAGPAITLASTVSVPSTYTVVTFPAGTYTAGDVYLIALNGTVTFVSGGGVNNGVTATESASSPINTALLAASSIADSYIAAQFELPLQVSPQGWDMSLTLYVCNIAAYLLYCQYGFNPNAPADMYIEDRYKRALTWLVSIQEEKIFPNWIDSSGVPTQQQEAGPYVESDLPVGFTNRGIERDSTVAILGAGWWWQ